MFNNDSSITTSPISPSDLRASLARDGFVRIPHAFPAATLQKYRAAAHAATTLAQQGQWPYIRTVGKQFPPWSVSDLHKGVWGVQHLLHPDIPHSATFQESYFNPTILKAVTDLLDCKEEDLVMELYNMLIAPEKDFALRWHRDDIPPTVSAEEEVERLQQPMMHAQWNLPLYRDDSLIVVPGSHRRARTDMEKGADPMEDDMPGQRIIKMEPGDIVFYNNNILHRGVYDSKAQRMTLHGTIGLAGADPARARNILQHGIGQWADSFDCSGLPSDLQTTAKAMQQRLMAMGKGTDTGFSQDD